MKKGIPLCNGDYLSRVLISTALGIDGNGIFPHTLRSSYHNLLMEAKKTNTSRIGKSFTIDSRIGNFIFRYPWTWGYIRKIGSDGMLNCYGLTNDGLKKETNRINKSISKGNKVIPSFFPEFSKGISQVTADTMQAIKYSLLIIGEGLSAFEINISCPNMKKETVSKNVAHAVTLGKVLRAYFPGLTLIFKISYAHPYELAQELEIIGIDIMHGINTILHEVIFPNKKSPLAHVGGGGVSGGPARELAMRYNLGLRKAISIPIIMGCGVCNIDDVHRYEDMGADAVSICTTALRNPQLTTTILRTHNNPF